jgi:hypothetical protein
VATTGAENSAIYPLITSVCSGWQANKEDSLPMGLSLYVTIGIFLPGIIHRRISFVFVCHRSSGVDYIAPRWNDGLDLWLGLTLLMSA